MRYNPNMQLQNEISGSPDIGALFEPHRTALQIHCYRMTGSVTEAEDLVQETMLRAWRGFGAFQGNSSLRTWLYRIATNVCLDALKKRRRRLLRPEGSASDPRLPVGPPTGELEWLEPYPDAELVDPGGGPEDRYLLHEKISLAFLEVLQLLPPRQRAIFLLRDVLSWRSGEIADLLQVSVPAVESALHRARTTLAHHRQPGNDDYFQGGSLDEATESLLERYVKAWETNDLTGLVDLMHAEVCLSMPPFPSWYQGRDSVRTILSLHPFGGGLRAGWRLFPTRANGGPAYVLYRADRPGEPFNAFGLMALSLLRSSGTVSISALTIFKDATLALRFGFPTQVEAL
jgi:RNA polymerase sigma-70 factor (ECF subfamily)